MLMDKKLEDFTDKKEENWDLTNYLLNPIILLQHNASTGGIGKAIKFDINNDGLGLSYSLYMFKAAYG